MPCPVTDSNIVEKLGPIIGQIITWVIVNIGWWFVDNSNDKRETRKEIRATIEAMQALLDQLERNAVSYHTGDNPNEALASDIKRDLYRKLPSKIQLLGVRGLIVDSLGKPIINLRKSITLENFDSKQFKKLQLGDELIRRVGAAREEVGQQLEQVFANYVSHP